jgi:cellulose synthase/poly-beta-1,6-N-acetylglucosamine synthase-like glycosyltransferase/peptidoglycan/xylan/chitin deacetylase (PgdA/CDA1 family)/spore germination protein YaaH
MAGKPIFYDATGRRATRIRRISWIVGMAVAVMLTGFGFSLVLAPPLAVLQLPGKPVAVHPKELVRRAENPGLLDRAERLATQARHRRAARALARRHHRDLDRRALPAILAPQKGRSLAIGFYTNWGGRNDPSWPALRRSLKYLDWVVPSWLTLSDPDETLKTTLDERALIYIRRRKPGVAILPMIQNAQGGQWNGPGLASLLADKDRRASLIEGITDFVAKHHLQGVMVDFENVPNGAHAHLAAFLNELSAAFAPHGWIIAQAVPFDDPDWPYQTYAGIVDYTVLMAYDQHDGSGEPGAIAAEGWFEKTLDKRMRTLDPASTIVALGSYGYDWSGGPADPISFAQAMVYARDSDAHVQFDPDANNPHFTYRDSGGADHQIWFLDAATAFNQIHAADAYQPAGYALWKLGSEDPSILPILGRPYNAPVPASLTHIPTNDDVDFDGEGEILRAESDPTLGIRKLDIDKETGGIDDETYVEFPTNYVIRRVGARPHELALTFDDGPDPEWTPQILAILKAKHVPATFFMIGENMEANPGLVRKVLDAGNEIGNHTFTHPDLADISPAAVRLELNATQRLFQALTGRSMRMFRPPYLADAEPSDADEIAPVEVAQRLGYFTVGTHVDTLDWTKPTVATMLNSVTRGVVNPNPELRGNIILMHDGGGDRSRTVALLPTLIDTLRAKGYHFVPVSQLAGFSRDAVMPHLPMTAGLLADRVVFLTFSWLAKLLYWCFLGAIVLGVARLFVLVGLAEWNRRHHKPAPPCDDTIGVSVLIPCFNEEKVIVTTLERILASDHARLEVLVIDDGSADRTALVARSRFADDPRVNVLSISNGGKAAALNAGLKIASHEVVVALDADTQFEATTISRLARWFVDPSIGAVAGNAKVGNRVNTVTRWQALEYVVAQNLERRALAALDTLTVVPGAVGAWRRETLNRLGGFPGETLAEDQDLTIGIQTAGYGVVFDPQAVAWTEAPATVRALARQRFRWAYGTLQCLWKYRRITFNPRYGELGLVALPQVWLFQILLTALAPVADLLLVWQLVGQWIAWSQHGSEFTSGNLQIVGYYYLAFVVVDLLAAAAGFLMEQDEDWSLLWWLVPQRFGYRQIMYYVVVRSLWTAARGPFVGWGKQERAGTVKARA